MLNLVTYLARVLRVLNSDVWVELKMVLGSAFVGTLICAQHCDSGVLEHCLLYWVTFFFFAQFLDDIVTYVV